MTLELGSPAQLCYVDRVIPARVIGPRRIDGMKMGGERAVNFRTWCALCLRSVPTCPGNVKVAASTCFANYKQHYVNIQKRENTLFTGVDVEILRSFCSSYIDAMKCITDLKSRCASNSKFQINSTLADFDVAVDELSSLCLNDVVYEVYARHRTCFEMNKAYSMRCFDNIMNTSVRLLRRIDHKPLDEFCGDMKKLLSCIGNNIERNCNREAASLVEKLVKPMIRRSSQCDYYETSPPRYGEPTAEGFLGGSSLRNVTSFAAVREIMP
ncbi:hypothetical protein FSP39_019833 [Pinctada imbricata]|uniref:Uncharacterized protein n=1 Tax=Pinctada imbricata TaxID=66713 RepID=A0AA88YRZ0_PINIB|nr:hypothetical protein FSP39_019833 [Pinctada imbricata]